MRIRILAYFVAFTCFHATLTQKSNRYDQCGGEGYFGPTECIEGTYCFKQSEWFSQCLRECPNGWECPIKDEVIQQTNGLNEYEKCDGVDFPEAKTCESGLICARLNKDYSQCRLHCPPDWECNEQ